MNYLEEATNYLIEKVGKVNVNNPKANSGAVLLRFNKNWEEDLSKQIDETFSLIQQQFARDTTDSPAGTAKLTNISMIIGKNISQKIQREPLPWNMQVRLGDLFVEAFDYVGLIELYYPKIKNSSYIISATARWTELADIPETVERIRIVGTTTTKPDKILGPVQRGCNNTFNVVKGSSQRIDVDAPWVSAINKLQQVGWRINRRILRALSNDRDFFISDLPIVDNDAKEQKRRSKKLEWMFIISKAEMLDKENVFYQYLDADYRGRLYYIEPFLNYQGSDIARGLMKFARSKPMTEEGLQWLAIHTANSFNMSYNIDEIPEWCGENYAEHLRSEGLESISVDKMTLSDRISWTNNYMEEILHAGATGSFTEDAEKPVAFLATCFEWLDIHDAASDNRIHMSSLPIAIDGSNNGWQHLGAISRDPNTGSLVGLTPVRIQHDFYVQTAKKLIELCGDEELYSILESMPMKHIRKGISKRGSMTRAYSAGQTKIAENMYFDCKTEDYHISYGITEKNCKDFAKLLIEAIDIVCPGPLTTMAYLQDLAAFEIGRFSRFSPTGELAGKEFKEIEMRRRELYTRYDLSDEELDELDKITKLIDSYEFKLVYGNGSKSLSWKTPAGFNVVYENWITTSSRCKGSIGTRRITHVAQVPSDRPDFRGFMCGISPNYIHSMDASHMALVIDNWNGDFGAVHDSFSTHACDVEQLLQKTKDVFIEMYDVPNFYDYIEDNIITNKEGLDVTQPDLGNLDIGGIHESEYFFA